MDHLTKLPLYVFENQFKIARTGFFGTVNIEGQIAKSLYQHIDVMINIINLQSVTTNEQIKFFINDTILRENSSKQDSLIMTKIINKDSLTKYEKLLLALENLLLYNMFNSDTAIIKNKVYNTDKYDEKFDHIDCHTIEYMKVYQDCIMKEYGNIVNILAISSSNYLVVKKYSRKNRDYTNSRLCDLSRKYIDNFFINVVASDEYDLIKFEDVIGRCILTKVYSDLDIELVISPCQDLYEHD